MDCPVCGSSCRSHLEKDGYEIFRCDACGVGFVGGTPSADELERLYAGDYYATSDGHGYRTPYRELEEGFARTYGRFLDDVARRFPGRRFARVLDVGCAYGYFLDAVRARGDADELVGVDITEEAAAEVRRKGHRFVAGFLEDAELERGHFDLVFMGDAFEHVRDPHVAVARIAELLAPGGVAVVTTVDFGSAIARWAGAHWRLLTPPEHLYFWTRRSLLRIFADHGLPGRVDRYWLYYPKTYVRDRLREQFGAAALVVGLYPRRLFPVYTLDTIMGSFERPRASP